MRLATSLFVLAALTVASTAGATNVLTQHNDSARTGANLTEKVLNTGNVRPETFGKLYTRPVDGSLYAQPLVVDGVVVVATMHNTVYAYPVDAKVAAPLWQRTLEPSVRMPDPNIGSNCVGYADIVTEIGIVSTPVIDPIRRLVYVVTSTRSGTGAAAAYGHWLHALDLATGAESLGGPRRIDATITGAGAGSDAGTLALQSRYQVQRASLLLANDTVYVGFAAYCDSGPFHGWLLGYDAGTLALRATFNSTPDGSEGGIWQSGQGPAADTSGNLYVVTGNGTSSMQEGGRGLGSAIVSLTPGLQVRDWFIPHDFRDLNDHDADLGSTGPLLVPGTSLLVAAGKSGRTYVVDRKGLGHFRETNDEQIVQTIQGSGPAFGAPVYRRSTEGAFVYLQQARAALQAFRVADGALNGPVASGPSALATGMPGGILSISADAEVTGTGIVWANVSIGPSANGNVVPGILRAYDADDISHEIWDSTMDARDTLGKLAKFAPPTIADGRVYVPTFSNELVVYGLRAESDGGVPEASVALDGGAPPIDAGAAPDDASAPGDAGHDAELEVTWSAGGEGCGVGGAASGAGALLVGGALVLSVLRRRRARGPQAG